MCESKSLSIDAPNGEAGHQADEGGNDYHGAEIHFLPVAIIRSATIIADLTLPEVSGSTVANPLRSLRSQNSQDRL